MAEFDDIKRAFKEALQESGMADNRGRDPAASPGRDIPERMAPAAAEAAHKRRMEQLAAEEKALGKLNILAANRDAKKEIAIEKEESLLELQRAKAEITEEEYITQKKQLAVRKQAIVAARKARNLLFEMSKSLGESANVFGKHPMFNTANFIKLGKAMKDAKGGILSMLGGGIMGILTAFVDGIINLLFAIDEAESKFKKATGASQKFAVEMTRGWDATKKYGVTLDQYSEAQTAAYNTITDFTTKGLAPFRQEMVSTIGILKKFGVAESASAQAMQHSIKIFGESGPQAQKTAIQLTSFAREVGLNAGELVGKFGEMAPRLAKLGAAGEKTFKDLARVQKITGFEMGKLLQMTDKFDTFEGAAKQAGMLNAAIGTNAVNAMDLLTDTDPVSRFEQIRSAILDTGMTFDSMSYYQRKFYADAAGLGDVSDLALLMSGNMELMGDMGQKTTDDYEEMAKKALQNQTVQERLQAILAEFIPILEPLLRRIQDWLTEFENDSGPIYDFVEFMKKDFIKMLESIPDHLATIWSWTKKIAIGYVILKVAMAVFTGIMQGYILTLRMKTAAESLSTKINLRSLMAMKRAIPLWLAFGAAMLMVGVGIYFAASGFAKFIAAWKGMTWDEMAVATVTLVAFGFAIFKFSMWLMASGKAALAAWKGMAILAGVTLVIGIAVALAATALAKMASSLAVLVSELKQAGSSAVGVLSLAYAIQILSSAMWSLRLSMVGNLMGRIAAAFQRTEEGVDTLTPKLKPFQALLEAISKISALDEVATGFGKIAANINGINLKNVQELTQLMTAAQAAQLAAKTAGFSAKAPTAGGGGGRDVIRDRSSTPAQPAKYDLTVNLMMDSDKFGKKVVEIVGKKVKEIALQNQ